MLNDPIRQLSIGWLRVDQENTNVEKRSLITSVVVAGAERTHIFPWWRSYIFRCAGAFRAHNTLLTIAWLAGYSAASRDWAIDY